MKKIFLLLFVMTGIAFGAIAQESKTMYIMKSGSVKYKSVVSTIDSIIFYNPGSSSVTGADIDFFYLDLWEGTQGAPGTPDGHSGDVRIIAAIDKIAGTITYTLPALPGWFTPEKMNVFPSVIQISEGATISPNWDVPQDFTKDVKYTVTAEDGVTKKEWTVKAAKYYTKEKWNVDYARLRGHFVAAGDQNPNSIAVIGDYIALSRAGELLNKADGTVSDVKLNYSGIYQYNGGTGDNLPSTDPMFPRMFPFFLTNDEAGNMLGINLGAWYSDACAVFKWTSATEAPEVVMEFPTKTGGVAFGSFGRKLQVLGDADGEGLIISPNNINDAARTKGEHYIWKINDGIVDVANPVVAQTNILNNGNAYQILTPLGVKPENPYYVSSTLVSSVYPNLRFGDLDGMSEIKGPYGSLLGEASANGWGNNGFHYLKLFTMDAKNMIATLSNSSSPGYYCFAIQERVTNTTLVPVATAAIEWNSTDWANGNATGSFTMEKVGNDVFFYVFPTNRAVVCYQLSKF